LILRIIVFAYVTTLLGRLFLMITMRMRTVKVTRMITAIWGGKWWRDYTSVAGKTLPGRSKTNPRPMCCKKSSRRAR
jgi:hypothetical protein